MFETNFLERIEDEFITRAGIHVCMLRLDKIHPIVSGNKIFKLKYYLQAASGNQPKTIITFGGPYSNHLHATAFACREAGLQSVGILRGPQPPILSDTLQDCLEYGMTFEWMNRDWNIQKQESFLSAKFPGALYIPQGGLGASGVKGAAEIMNLPGAKEADTVLAACGTGTMGAGLMLGKMPHQRMILISVLKNNFSVQADLCRLTGLQSLEQGDTALRFDFHLGGYARKSGALFTHMNTFFELHKIPTDFVYTGKLITAFYDLLASGHFRRGERVMIIHSGGLQGNRSLTNGELIF